MALKRLAIFLLLFVLLTGLSSAELVVIPYTPSYDFTFKADYNNLAVCPCSTVTQPITITNTGTYPTIFTLSDNLDYVQLSANEIVIGPGQTSIVLASITAPCDGKGYEELVLEVTSSFQIKKQIIQTIEFLECSNTQLSLSDLNLTENICEPFSTSLFITNTGTFVEEYLIEPPAIAGTVTLSAGSVLLPPKATAEIKATYDLPCELSGDYELDYLVTAKQTDEKQYATQLLSVPADYDFDLEGPSSATICQSDSHTFSVLLSNKNNFANDFHFDVDAPIFVDFPYETITVQANEAVELNLTINPEYRQYIGDDKIEIEVTSKFGEIKKELSINLSVENCYDPSAGFWIPKTKYVCADDETSMPFTLVNEGSKSVDIKVFAHGTDMVFFEEPVYTLEPYSSIEVPLHFVISEEVDQRIPVLIEVFRGDELLFDKSFTLSVDTKEFCYLAAPIKDNLEVRYNSQSLDFVVRNEGTRYNSYSVDLSAPDFITLDPENFEMGSSDKKRLNFYFLDSEDYLADNNLTTLIGTTVPVSLEITNLDSGEVFYSDMSIEFVDYPFITRAAKYAWNKVYYTDSCILVTILLLLLLFAFLLVFLIKRKNYFRFPVALTIILIALIIIAALVVFLTYGVPTKGMWYTSYDLETNSTTHLLIEEDGKADYDLNEFFFDPDGDIVSYEVIQINESELGYELKDNLLELEPVKDWNGMTNIRLAATDAYDEVAISNSIRVDVLPVEDYTCKEFYLSACAYFNLALFILLCILIFLTFSFRFKK